MRVFYLALIASITGLSACENGSVVTESGDVGIAVPERIANARAIDSNLLTLELTVDGTPVVMVANAARTEWIGNVRIPEGVQQPLSIAWAHDGLPIAGLDKTIGPFSSDTSVSIADNEYITTGTDYNQDRDELSNLEELEADFDPLDDQSPGVPLAALNAIIPRIEGTDVPDIDGTYDDVWDQAVYQDREGNGLLIDNLMIDLGADRADQTAEFRWGAMHDGTYLYILVLAEESSIATLQADSMRPWRDDTLNVFIDGDNSKGTTYDGANDYHFFLPFLKLLEPDTNLAYTLRFDGNEDLIRDANGQVLVTLADGSEAFLPVRPPEANDLSDPDGRGFFGANSLPPPSDDAITFANCNCATGQHTYEVRLRIADYGIGLKRAFGFELQIDDDNDGAGRDSRYGWIHPSRVNTDVDNTWQNPSFMGTVILQ